MGKIPDGVTVSEDDYGRYSDLVGAVGGREGRRWAFGGFEGHELSRALGSGWEFVKGRSE